MWSLDDTTVQCAHSFTPPEALAVNTDIIVFDHSDIDSIHVGLYLSYSLEYHRQVSTFISPTLSVSLHYVHETFHCTACM